MSGAHLLIASPAASPLAPALNIFAKNNRLLLRMRLHYIDHIHRIVITTRIGAKDFGKQKGKYFSTLLNRSELHLVCIESFIGEKTGTPVLTCIVGHSVHCLLVAVHRSVVRTALVAWTARGNSERDQRFSNVNPVKQVIPRKGRILASSLVPLLLLSSQVTVNVQITGYQPYTQKRGTVLPRGWYHLSTDSTIYIVATSVDTYGKISKVESGTFNCF